MPGLRMGSILEVCETLHAMRQYANEKLGCKASNQIEGKRFEDFMIEMQR
jgi:hypothetical protein